MATIPYIHISVDPSGERKVHIYTRIKKKEKQHHDKGEHHEILTLKC